MRNAQQIIAHMRDPQMLDGIEEDGEARERDLDIQERRTVLVDEALDQDANIVARAHTYKGSMMGLL